MRARYILPVCTLLLYLPFLTRTYYWDGVLFSLNIERVHRGEVPAAILFHPNHLLYSALGYVLYSALWACRIHLRALTVLQLFNVSMSAAAGYALYGLAKRVTRSAALALFCWVLFTCGATWWKFSTDADSYILSVLLIIWAVRFSTGDPPKIFATAVCHTLAMLFHELAIFVYAPVIAAILLNPRQPIRKRIWTSILYCAGTGAAVAAAYLACYSQADRTAYPTLLKWITSYASDSSFTHSFGQLVNSYLMSYVKLFAGGKLVFLGEYFSAPVVLSLAICIGALVTSIRLFRTRTLAQRQSTVVLWVWLLTSAFFLAIWDPGSAFHKLFVWPAIVLLIGSYVRTKAGLALAIALGAWNFAAFIYPHAHDSADPVLSLARKVDRELPRDATVYYNQLIPDDWYLEYFAPGRAWVHLPVPARTTGPVCMETTALEASRAETDPLQRWDLVNGQHHIRLECLK